MKRIALSVSVLLSVTFVPAVVADEGMWQPHQLQGLRQQLEERGLEIHPEKLADLTAHPMNAVINLGGCTASFVSPEGLAVTNHHCAYRVLQYNSTEENNLLRDGFLAREKSQEIFAGPGSRILVTVAVDDVTAAVRKGLGGMSPRERYDAIEKRRKELIAECESDPGHRCRVAAFHGSLQYYLIKALEIRDVRIVYAPAGSVGRYGGDVDNWMWPRHTGDFTFYRAYVGADGKPADHSDDNVPFRPEHYLKVSDAGLEPGDYVMVTGYPGRTNRHRLAAEVENEFGWRYPRRQALMQAMMDLIGEVTEGHPDDAIKYAGTVAGLSNTVKNYSGMLDGFAKSDILERKRRVEEQLVKWTAGMGQSDPLASLREVVAEAQAVRERDLYSPFVRRAALLGSAGTLYRLSHEKEKPDAEREPGYQERDWRRIKERLTRLDRTFSPRVDRALLRWAILEYAAISAGQHVAALDEWFGLRGNAVDESALDALLGEMYAKTQLGDQAKRLAWLEATPKKFEESDDPFIQLAVKLYPGDREREAEQEERLGRLQELQPLYMKAMIAFLDSRGESVYPDANSTLRVSYGTVQGYSPRDALTYTPFTTLAGILEKDTGEDPFDSPPELLTAIRERRFGRYADPSLDSVPVNFLADLDITGGNSGSPTLNARGELIGLVFDGNYEAMASDWVFMPEITRSIHVDIRAVLWFMDAVDEADHLLTEMGVTPAV